MAAFSCEGFCVGLGPSTVKVGGAVYLISRGADVTLRNDRGRTAFDMTTSAQIKTLVRPPATDPIGRNLPAPPPRPNAPST